MRESSFPIECICKLPGRPNRIHREGRNRDRENTVPPGHSRISDWTGQPPHSRSRNRQRPPQELHTSWSGSSFPIEYLCTLLRGPSRIHRRGGATSVKNGRFSLPTAAAGSWRPSTGKTAGSRGSLRPRSAVPGKSPASRRKSPGAARFPYSCCYPRG